MNMTSKEIISSNSSFIEALTPIRNTTSSLVEDEDVPEEYWPNWIRRVMCISHLCLAFSSSVNFYIYYAKRKALSQSGPSKSFSWSKYLKVIILTIIYSIFIRALDVLFCFLGKGIHSTIHAIKNGMSMMTHSKGR